MVVNHVRNGGKIPSGIIRYGLMMLHMNMEELEVHRIGVKVRLIGKEVRWHVFVCYKMSGKVYRYVSLSFMIRNWISAM